MQFHKVQLMLYQISSVKNVNCVRNLELDVRLPNNKHPVSKFLLKLHTFLRLSNLEAFLFPLYIVHIIIIIIIIIFFFIHNRKRFF